MNRILKNSLIALFIVSSLAIQVKVRILDQTHATMGGLKNKTQAPDFTLHSLDGKSVSLAQFKGKPVVIDFFATWCGPCAQETTSLKAWRNTRIEAGKEPMTVLAISVDQDLDDLVYYMKKHPSPFIVLHDLHSSVAQQYKVKALPTLYLVGKDGKIVLMKEGVSPGLSYSLDEYDGEKASSPGGQQ